MATLAAQLDIFAINIYEMTIEQSAAHFPRVIRTPNVSFEQFLISKGEPNLQHKALNGICATAFYDCTRKSATDHRNVVQGKNAIRRLAELTEEYMAMRKSNQIQETITYKALDLTKQCDYLRAKLGLRRAVKTAHKKGLAIPDHNKHLLDY